MSGTIERVEAFLEHYNGMPDDTAVRRVESKKLAPGILTLADLRAIVYWAKRSNMVALLDAIDNHHKEEGIEIEVHTKDGWTYLRKLVDPRTAAGLPDRQKEFN